MFEVLLCLREEIIKASVNLISCGGRITPSLLLVQK